MTCELPMPLSVRLLYWIYDVWLFRLYIIFVSTFKTKTHLIFALINHIEHCVHVGQMLKMLSMDYYIQQYNIRSCFLITISCFRNDHLKSFLAIFLNYFNFQVNSVLMKSDKVYVFDKLLIQIILLLLNNCHLIIEKK